MNVSAINCFKTMNEKYCLIFNEAMSLMDMFDGLEPTSALKQCATDHGIQEGEDLRKFVEWALDNIC